VQRKRTARAIALAATLVLAACNGLTVNEKGVYTSSPTQQITGTVEVAAGDSLTSVTVNGQPATVDGDTWHYDLPLDGPAIFNPVLVEARFAKGDVIRERRTVVYGDGTTARIVPEGQRLDNAVGLRVNERSFTKLGPVIRNLTTIDTAAIAPPGTVVLDECITRIGICTVYATATISAAPTLDDFSVALDSNQGNVRAVVTLDGLHVPLSVRATILGIPSTCALDVDAATVTIDGNYALSPDAADPHNLDVNLVGATPTVTANNVTSDFTTGVCSIPVIEQIVGLLLPDVTDLLESNLTTLLGDADGAGALDSPVADAVEGALAQVNIAGPIGTSLGLDLDSTITAADEDTAGIALRSTALFTAAGVAPGAPDLTGSVGFGDTLDAIGSTTPSGAPFDVAVGASVTGFNQLLAGETERGLVNVDVTELNGQPVTLKTLFDAVGAGGLVTDDRPVVIQLRPEVAPIVTTADPPAGSLGQMRFNGYRVTVKTNDEASALLMELVIDFTTGVGLGLDGGGLAFDFDQPAPEDFSSDIVQNPLKLPESVVDQVFAALSPQVFAAVGQALPRFPLPQFVGLDLSLVEVTRVGPGFVLYTDLVPA
jgi:hypothetical protein